MQFDYNEHMSTLWDNLKTKVIEKMSDSRKIMSEELRQIQGRHRQFYKVQFNKAQLDKFEPSRELKAEEAEKKKPQGNEKKKKTKPIT